MPIRTYYDALGVSHDASVEEIRSAFRRLAMQWHPDRNKRPDATAQFRRINEAYQCLRDPAARRAYDETLRRSNTGQQHEHAGHRARSEKRARAEEDFLREVADLWDAFAKQFTLRPETVVAVFTRIDDWLRQALAQWRSQPSRS